MGLIWRKDYLDLVLVPSGLLLMFGYHLFLLYRYLKFPQTTIMGLENHNKRAWVERMSEVDVKDRGPAVSVISSNISAATSLSSISLVLSSLIGAWIGSSSVNIFRSSFVYGSIDSSIVSIKYIALLSCFLVAFVCFFQTARYLVHANFLISMPNSDIPVRYVENEVIRGSNFWLIGIRSLYFAMNLLLWIFGPIPMFICSVLTVGVLLNLDRNTTPLHQYKPLVNRDLQKTGQETTAVTN
ncbi:uncharacterized protein LOC111392975 [Olea europaea subsp. europaea]|uniref:Uncharacterized protein LOC111392975 n=1 Tax=Olea europaea subsp. europaea TaxID=158383 RepID=A0A8S0RNW9_OLEEU|nr:uncharacterized protein LOC111392975 [Olea europaea subsp. europaea]